MNNEKLILRALKFILETRMECPIERNNIVREINEVLNPIEDKEMGYEESLEENENE